MGVYYSVEVVNNKNEVIEKLYLGKRSVGIYEKAFLSDCLSWFFDDYTISIEEAISNLKKEKNDIENNLENAIKKLLKYEGKKLYLYGKKLD